MKNTLNLIFALSFFLHGYSQGYYINDKKTPLNLNTKYFFIESKTIQNNEGLLLLLGKGFKISKSGFNEISNSLNKIGDFNKESYTNFKLFRAEVEITSEISQLEYESLINNFKKYDAIDYVGPCFYSEKNKKLEPSNMILVKLKSQQDFDKLKLLAQKVNVEIIGQNSFLPLWYTLTCSKNSNGYALDISNKFYESGYFACVEPDLYCDQHLHSINDPLYSNQWGLKNTGQSGGYAGTDINIDGIGGAWMTTTGNTNIVTAIIDVGFEMDHPDLSANVFGAGHDSNSGGTTASIVHEKHATSCAGIVAAVQNNNLGVSGVAPTSKIMSVSIDFDNATSQTFANAISWASHNGASILSNSWGGGSDPSHVIDDAINDALTNGRDGLGCVVVFSTGNDNTDVASPAGDIDDILAVGAIDRCGYRSGTSAGSPLTCDPWCSTCDPGSNHGTKLDVVAPGSSIYTTDRQGSNGYDALDYTSDFGGTSAACPFVAGTAALLLSVNPCLTQKEVHDIICRTAQKITLTYMTSTASSWPHHLGFWNDELGYGLIDASRALYLANTMYLQNATEASVDRYYQTIIAGKNVTNQTSVGDYIIPSGSTVNLKATKYIALEPGFIAEAGSVFSASIEEVNTDCSFWTTPPIIGKTDYFNEINAKIDTTVLPIFGDKSIKVYPNPAADYINIDYSINNPQPIKIILTNIYGQVVYKSDENKEKGNFTEKITNLSQYANEILLLSVCRGNDCSTFKILKLGSY